MGLRQFLNTPRSISLNPERIARRRSKRGFIASVTSMVLFSVIFWLVRKNRSAAADAAVTLQVQKQDHPYFDWIMRIVSWPGFPPQSRILPPGIAAALWLRGMRLEALFQLAAWGTGGVSSTFKRIVRRKRPSSEGTGIKVAVANIGGSSFPSGHVIIYMGVYGFLAYLADTWVRAKSIRTVVVALLTSLLVLVGPSRIYLGHHWFTDVAASYLLGTTWLVGLTALYRRTKRWMIKGA
jgi:membrane-associated phospholipid phosphatase